MKTADFHSVGHFDTTKLLIAMNACYYRVSSCTQMGVSVGDILWCLWAPDPTNVNLGTIRTNHFPSGVNTLRNHS